MRAHVASTNAYLFMLFALVVLPIASAPPLSITFDVATSIDGVKLAVLGMSCVFAWAAILVSWRTRSMRHIIAQVFLRGFSGWTTVLIVSMLASGLLAPVDIGTGWIGAEYRLDGALAWAVMLHAVQLTYALTSSGVIQCRRFGIIALIGAAASSSYLILEYLSMHPWMLMGLDVSPDKPLVAAFGNQGAATIYLAVLYCVAVGTFLNSKLRTERRIVAVLILLIAVGLALTAGRAGIAGAVIALALLGAVRWREHGPLGAFVPASALAFLMGVLLMMATVSDLTAERAARFTDTEQTGVALSLRGIAWKTGAQAAIAYPWFGSGPGAFADLVWQFVDPNDEATLFEAFLPEDFQANVLRDGRVLIGFNEGTEEARVAFANFDKAHNYFIDVAIQFGLVVMLMLMVWWGWVLRTAWHTRTWQPALLLAVVAYLLAVQTWFFMIPVDPPILAFVGAAMGAAHRYGVKGPDAPEPAA